MDLLLIFLIIIFYYCYRSRENSARFCHFLNGFLDENRMTRMRMLLGWVNLIKETEHNLLGRELESAVMMVS